MANAGIDYGHGTTNIDHATGIRYGVISQHSVTQAWADSAEPDYGPASCPKCGNDAAEYDADKHGHCASYHRAQCDDFACEACEICFESGDAFGDEPRSWSYSGDGYELVDCLDSDIMVLKSQFYTLGNYCSPCVPGGVSLESSNPDGAKAYCLGHDWFEEGKAPYPVYSVETGKEVAPAP
jgi:ribosomal protein L37AE/L43A